MAEQLFFKLIQAVKRYVVGNTGWIMSSSGPESDFKPKHTEKPGLVGTGFTVSIDEPVGRPDGPGWEQLPSGDWTRKIKCGHGAGIVEDETRKPERRLRVIPNEFNSRRRR